MNRRSLFRRITFTLAAMCLPNSIKLDAQASDQRDGNWWNDLDDSFRGHYVLGFMDGIRLGNHFSHWGMSENESKECTGAVGDSFSTMENQYLSKLTVRQLKDGLDDFYKDYRNRRIKTDGAVWLVVQGISGVPSDTLQKSIDAWRRNASKY
jgi:hypothetical protein